jgi:anti-anti-sigma regulatory factor
MLRITRITGNDSAPRLKLEGKLLGPWVGELKRACAEPAESAGGLCLDLSAVTFVDAAGLKLLRELLGRGITLAACSGLVAELLHVEKR